PGQLVNPFISNFAQTFMGTQNDVFDVQARLQQDQGQGQGQSQNHVISPITASENILQWVYQPQMVQNTQLPSDFMAQHESNPCESTSVPSTTIDTSPSGSNTLMDFNSGTPLNDINIQN